MFSYVTFLTKFCYLHQITKIKKKILVNRTSKNNKKMSIGEVNRHFYLKVKVATTRFNFIIPSGILTLVMVLLIILYVFAETQIFHSLLLIVKINSRPSWS